MEQLKQAAAQVPGVWKLVPVMPTKEMVAAGNKPIWPLPSAMAYAAMLAAAPEAPVSAAQVPSLSDARDAARWNMLPAFFEEYQIDAMKLYRDIDAAIAKATGSAS